MPLQIIGQTPRPSVGVRSFVWLCVCLEPFVLRVEGSADSGTLHALRTVYSVDAGRGGAPPKTTAPREDPLGLVYTSLLRVPFLSPLSLFLFSLRIYIYIFVFFLGSLLVHRSFSNFLTSSSSTLFKRILSKIEIDRGSNRRSLIRDLKRLDVLFTSGSSFPFPSRIANLVLSYRLNDTRRRIYETADRYLCV